jgi:hypothetical protein
VRAALLLLVACGGGATTLVKPVQPRTTLSLQEAGVGQKVKVTATWQGTCMARATVGDDTCRAEDHPVGGCSGRESGALEERPCAGVVFTSVIDCAECAHLGDKRDEVVALHAGPLHMVTHFERTNGQRADVIDKLQIRDPDAGSVTVTCVDHQANAVACAQAQGFTVKASVGGHAYSVFAIEVEGAPRLPASVTVTPAVLPIDRTEVAIYALDGVPNGPVSITVGGVTVTHDFTR